MSESLAVVRPQESLALREVSQGLFKSGMFPNAKNEFGAFAIVEYGHELGIPPMMSLKNINIISGQLAVNGQLMLSLAMARGVIYEVKEETDKGCTILFKRQGFSPYEATFNEKDAQAAGLTGKDNWKKYPKDMYFWRAVAKGVRRIAPEAVMGLYTADEISEGQYIDVTAVPVNGSGKQEARSPTSTDDPKCKQHDGLDQKGMQDAIKTMLSDMFGEFWPDYLRKATTFERNGKTVEGKSSPYDLAVKPNDRGETRTSVTYMQVRDDYKKWQDAESVTDVTEEVTDADTQ